MDNIPTEGSRLNPGLGTCQCYRAELANTPKRPKVEDGDSASKG